MPTLRFVSFASVALALVPCDAFAFQIETPVTYGCHERVTIEAHDTAGFPDGSMAPAPNEDQYRTSQDLIFTLPADDGDLWTMTMLIGVRFNDIKDYQLIDPASLLNIHDDPKDQPAHCIRRIEDDYEAGDVAALEACRQFIIDQLTEGRWFADTIDMSGTEPVPLYLAFRHRIAVDLPRFAFRLGRAIHALEDGYAHTLRNPDDGRVRHVTNWIDFSTSDDYDPARDGFEHLSTVDDCLRNTPVERYHLVQAKAAVNELLIALADPGGDGNARQARVEAVLDRAFTIEPGCTYANHYCDAPELDELDGGCTAGGGGAGLLIVLALAGIRTRRGDGHNLLNFLREGCESCVRPLRVSALRCFFACLVVQVVSVPSVSADDVHETTVWHVDGRFGGALDHAAVAFMGGGGLDHGRWTYALSVEWNPFFSLETKRGKPGALNVYASLSRRWYDGERFALYSRAEVGTSTMLFDVVGVDQGKTGLYLGGALLGVTIKKHHNLRINFDPSHYVVPIPRLTGLPFYYRQYRISIGVEYRFE